MEDNFRVLKLDNPQPFKANYLKIYAQNDTLLCYDFVDRIEQVNDSSQWETPKLYKLQ